MGEIFWKGTDRQASSRPMQWLRGRSYFGDTNKSKHGVTSHCLSTSVKYSQSYSFANSLCCLHIKMGGGGYRNTNMFRPRQADCWGTRKWWRNIYRTSQEEMSVFWEVTVSAILIKKCICSTCVLFRKFFEIELFHCTDEQHAMSSHELHRDRAISLYSSLCTVQTSNTPCPHTSCTEIELFHCTVHFTDEQHAMTSQELQGSLILTVEFSKMFHNR
jgi:hypothetical protein